MRTDQPRTIYLKDYRAPAFLIDQTDLHFDLQESGATVTARLAIKRNPDCGQRPVDLVLDGEELELQQLSLNGDPLAPNQYEETPGQLRVMAVPDAFELTCVTLIRPQDNTKLEGLYKSSGMFCTQCEAEGFRRITYYLDRPDVMARFRTTIEADKTLYPVLLSNGNKVAEGETEANRHWVTWEDPFKKPCYLFALVAGDLVRIEDQFVTQSGRSVDLHLFVEAVNRHKCEFAMRSLKAAMRWDETTYGREYDLDIFMIVAVNDFNMGAMENKGLNIFNSSCVLAHPDTATDQAFQRVEGVVAHEYFHNWSGNRVTCRDWFQLSLKEGFTVYRDAQFSADMGSPTVKRIEDVTLLRTAQFAEDASPMAHPIRPASYIEISNFYTLTVYEKGAEVVGMIHTLLGDEGFRRGSDLYFERHDGEAVTTDDFVKAMEQANDTDLSQFRRWYDQAGTPVLEITGQYDAATQCYHLKVRQHCPPTPERHDKQPYLIPLRLGLLDQSGRDLPLRIAGHDTDPVLRLTDAEHTFVFEDVPHEPVPSLLRGFSAPVRLNFDYSREQLMFLMHHDSDGFNRWDAGQKLAVGIIQQQARRYRANEAMQLDPSFVAVVGELLNGAVNDDALLAKTLMLPSEAYLGELAQPFDVEAIHHARNFVRRELAGQLADAFLACARRCDDRGDYQFHADAVGRRSLKNTCLGYLVDIGQEQALTMVEEQFHRGDNMTDVSAALTLLTHSWQDALKETALAHFYETWRDDALVMDLWLSIQASNPQPGGLQRVRELMSHPVFSIKNPNKVRSLLGAFAQQNLINFHQADGSGYQFLADQILQLDAINPQVAARLVTPLTRWRKFEQARADLMRQALARIKAQTPLSKDVYEVVSKSLD